MKRRLYIASPSEYWDRAHILGEDLIAELGDVDVVSRWHERPVAKYPEREDERAVQIDKNVTDLERATVVVALCDAGTPRTTFADIGYALGRGLPIIWVRGRVPSQQCLFDSHRLVKVIESAPRFELAQTIARIIRLEVESAA